MFYISRRDDGGEMAQEKAYHGDTESAEADLRRAPARQDSFSVASVSLW